MRICFQYTVLASRTIPSRTVERTWTARTGTTLGGLDESAGNNLGGQVQVLAEVLNSLVGEVVVIVLPREAGGDVSARGHALQRLDDVKVGHVNVLVLGGVEVLLRHHDSLLEEVLVDLLH